MRTAEKTLHKGTCAGLGRELEAGHEAAQLVLGAGGAPGRHEHQGLHALGPPPGIADGGQSTEGVAEDDGGLGDHGVEHLLQGVEGGLGPHAARGHGGPAVAREVGSVDAPVVPPEHAHQRHVVGRAGTQAMQQHHRRAGSAAREVEHMSQSALDLDHVAACAGEAGGAHEHAIDEGEGQPQQSGIEAVAGRAGGRGGRGGHRRLSGGEWRGAGAGQDPGDARAGAGYGHAAARGLQSAGGERRPQGSIMSRFHGSIDERFTVPLPPERVRQLLGDPQLWVELQQDVETATAVHPGTLDVVLKPHEHGPVRFQGRFRADWRVQGEVVTWRSQPAKDANFELDGKATVTAAGSGSAVHWLESVAAEIPVNRIVRKMVAPIADRMMARGLRGYVQRVREHLSKTA